MKPKLVVYFGLALILFGVSFYAFTRVNSALMVSMIGALTIGMALLMEWQTLKKNHFEQLTLSWGLKYSEMQSHISGLKDRINHQDLKLDQFHADVEEVDKNFGPDAAERLHTRLDNLEARVGLQSAFGITQPQEAVYTPKPKRSQS